MFVFLFHIFLSPHYEESKFINKLIHPLDKVNELIPYSFGLYRFTLYRSCMIIIHIKKDLFCVLT